MLTLAAGLTAAQLLIHAPQQALGATQATIERRIGTAAAVGTDVTPSRFVDGGKDNVITLDYPGAQVRLYIVPSTNASALFSVTVARDLFATGSPVGVGSERAAVLRELGGPTYEDDDQLVYADPHPDDPSVADRMRLVLEKDRVVGIEWRYAVGWPRR